MPQSSCIGVVHKGCVTAHGTGTTASGSAYINPHVTTIDNCIITKGNIEWMEYAVTAKDQLSAAVNHSIATDIQHSIRAR